MGKKKILACPIRIEKGKCGHFSENAHSRQFSFDIVHKHEIVA